MTDSAPRHTDTTARIEADPDVPAIRITRDFTATPAQLHRAHTDPELYAQWCGPHDLTTTIGHWDARTGGSWSFSNQRDGEEIASFHGSFHDVTPERIVQTFTYDGWPESVSLETMTFEDLGDGRTRLHTVSLVGSFEERAGWLDSGMETGVNDGYEKLDGLLAKGEGGWRVWARCHQRSGMPRRPTISPVSWAGGATGMVPRRSRSGPPARSWDTWSPGCPG